MLGEEGADAIKNARGMCLCSKHALSNASAGQVLLLVILQDLLELLCLQLQFKQPTLFSVLSCCAAGLPNVVVEVQGNGF